MSECWRCGRPVPEWAMSYVFGVVCDRAECKRIKAALNPRFLTFWFQASPGRRGRAGSFDPDGSPRWPRGITGSSLQTNIDSKQRARERCR